jgi:hypothetical protein
MIIGMDMFLFCAIRKYIIITMSIIVMLVCCSCLAQGRPTLTPTSSIKLISKNPHIRGTIVDITFRDGLIRGIFVMGKKEPDTTYDRADIGINDNTIIYKKVGSEIILATPEDLSIMKVVEVLFTGPRFTSNPIQGVADEIVILE